MTILQTITRKTIGLLNYLNTESILGNLLINIIRCYLKQRLKRRDHVDKNLEKISFFIKI